MPPAPANPMPDSARGQAGILPSPGRVSATGIIDRAGAGPAVVGGRVPATVVGTVVGGVVLGPVVDDRRGTVLATVGRVVTARAVVGVVCATVGDVLGSVGGSVVPNCGVTTWAAARAQRTPPPNAASAQRQTTATGRDTCRCLPAGPACPPRRDCHLQGRG